MSPLVIRIVGIRTVNFRVAGFQDPLLADRQHYPLALKERWHNAKTMVNTLTSVHIQRRAPILPIESRWFPRLLKRGE